MSPRSTDTAICALCGAAEVSEPRDTAMYCRACWTKKMAVEEVVAQEFAIKRYIRAQSAEKYLVYHATQKRPCGQLIVVDDGYDLFLNLVLYPTFAWDEPAYFLEGDPSRSRRAMGRRQVAPGGVSFRHAGTRRLARRTVAGPDSEGLRNAPG